MVYRLYKISNWFYKHHIPIIPKLIKAIIYLLFSCSIPYQAKIGEKCKFLYGGLGTVISKKTTIGNNVYIGTNVLTGGRSNQKNHPIIGNNVYIATGVKILGDVKISDNVIIGANAVVIKDVPSNCSVAGVPAKIIKKNIKVEDYSSLGRY